MSQANQGTSVKEPMLFFSARVYLGGLQLSSFHPTLIFWMMVFFAVLLNFFLPEDQNLGIH